MGGGASSIQRGDVSVLLGDNIAGSPHCTTHDQGLWQHWHSTETVIDSYQIVHGGNDVYNNIQCFVRAAMKDGSIRIGRMGISKEGPLQGRAAFAFDGVEAQFADGFDILGWRQEYMLVPFYPGPGRAMPPGALIVGHMADRVTPLYAGTITLPALAPGGPPIVIPGSAMTDGLLFSIDGVQRFAVGGDLAVLCVHRPGAPVIGWPLTFRAADYWQMHRQQALARHQQQQRMVQMQQQQLAQGAGMQGGYPQGQPQGYPQGYPQGGFPQQQQQQPPPTFHPHHPMHGQTYEPYHGHNQGPPSGGPGMAGMAGAGVVGGIAGGMVGSGVASGLGEQGHALRDGAAWAQGQVPGMEAAAGQAWEGAQGMGQQGMEWGQGQIPGMEAAAGQAWEGAQGMGQQGMEWGQGQIPGMEAAAGQAWEGAQGMGQQGMEWGQGQVPGMEAAAGQAWGAAQDFANDIGGDMSAAADDVMGAIGEFF